MQTFDIPGGTVTFRDKEQLSVGQSRAIALATRRLPKRALIAAPVEEGQEPVEVETDLAGFPIDLTDDEVEASWAYNDTLLLAYMAEWSLDVPMPKTREDLGTIESGVFAALCKVISTHVRPDDADPVDEFSVDAVEDKGSPIGA